MNTKKFLLTKGLSIMIMLGFSIMIMLLATLLTNAQIPIQGLANDQEGIALWNADGTGPEPAGYGHSFQPIGSVGYYTASRDYDGIDPDPEAALCHFLDDIIGFPLFMQALYDNGFSPGQVKVKTDLFELKDDVEGEDWFTINNEHYYNRYDGYYFIELNGEPMVTVYTNYIFSSISSTGDTSQLETSFSQPVNTSANSSDEVKEVATAFLNDMNGQELRFIVTDKVFTGSFPYINGRLGGYVDIVSGYLEKGLPELPVIGLGVDHEGLACWNANGTGPEPEAYGHTFYYSGTEWLTAYYIASRDYDDIDDDPNASLCHFIDDAKGFPNLEIQLVYRGFTMDQLKLKTNIATMGYDIEGEDWGLEGNIHWYHTYGNTLIFEIDNEPILECVIDTNYNFLDLDHPDADWWSYSSYVNISDISASASNNARHVASSFLKDIGGHSIKTYAEGNQSPGGINTNGRMGEFHEILNGRMEAKILSQFIQQIPLSLGYSFVSSRIIPEDPDMTIVMADILNNNLDFVRNSQGAMLRKIGPNWVNGIGDWIVEEGYLVKMFADDSFIIRGDAVDPTTPIPVVTGYQFVSYFPENAMDALLAFETIIGDDLDFIRNSQGQVLRKIGPNWVNNIGDAIPTEGYLVKMFAGGEIIYPAIAKSSGKITAIPRHFTFVGGNAADPVYTIYISGLDIGDEVAAFNGDNMVGAMRINSQNTFENELAVFSTLNNGKGYEKGNPIKFKIWSESNILATDFTMEAMYDSYVSDVYPEEDGKYSIVNIKKGSIENTEETISVYPNPSKGIFNILLEGIKGDTQIKVLDIIGKERSNFKFRVSASTQLDLTGLASGVYFISFSGKDFRQVKKIVIQ